MPTTYDALHDDGECQAPTNGICRYCGEPRPDGYSITCGRSDCQEAAFRDKERRRPRLRGSK